MGLALDSPSRSFEAQEKRISTFRKTQVLLTNCGRGIKTLLHLDQSNRFKSELKIGKPQIASQPSRQPIQKAIYPSWDRRQTTSAEINDQSGAVSTL